MVKLERDWEHGRLWCSTWYLNDGFRTEGMAEQVICEQTVAVEFIAKRNFNMNMKYRIFTEYMNCS